jgi:LysM repeat protein
MISYTVRRGDTLGRIARRFYGDAGRYPLIVAANRIPDPDRLVVGRKLVIPDLAVADGATAAPAPAPAPRPDLVPPRLPQIGLSLQRLDRLHPAVRTRGAALLELCSHSGLAILVSQGMRTWEEQDALYAKGRTIPPLGPKYFVTRARGGQSYHNFGLAFDIVVLDAVTKAGWDDDHPGWRMAGALGKSVGLEWGGGWAKLKDLPHYQYTGGLSLPQCRDLYPSGLDELWRRVT